MGKYFAVIVWLVLSLGMSNTFAADVSVSEPRFKAVLPSKNLTSAYMTLTNNGPEPRKLIGVRSAYTSSIEMHTIIDLGNRKGMRRVTDVPLPVGKDVAFASGGLHLMLFGIDKPLPDSFDIELCFDDDTSQQVNYKKEAW